MIGFDLTPEQQALQAKARRFAREVIAPVAAQHDRDGTFPLEVLQKAYQEGFFTPLVPRKYGGQGLSVLDTCILYEELAAGCMGIYLSIFVSTLALYPIAMFGTEEQKQRFLKPFCEKFSLASYCLSEHTVGSDPASMKTTAVLDGDHYVVNGTKMWITNGGYADFYLVFANTDPQKRHKGIICLIVPSHLEGIRRGEPIDKMGQRASNTTAVIFKNVRVPRENLLAAEGEGFKKALGALDITRPMIAVGAVGIARTAMELSVAYAKKRIQFGVPIARHQAVQFMLADMAKDHRRRQAPGLESRVARGSGDPQHQGGSHCKGLCGGHGHAGHNRRGSSLRGSRVHPVAPCGEVDEGRQGHSDLRGNSPDHENGHCKADAAGNGEKA